MNLLVRKTTSANAESADREDHIPVSNHRHPTPRLFHRSNNSRDSRKSRADLKPVTGSPLSAIGREKAEQVRKQHSLAELRRAIVRKASTFNLHTRHRSAIPSSPSRPRSEHLFPDFDQDSPRAVRAPPIVHEERPVTASTEYSEAVESFRPVSDSGSSHSIYSQITTVPVRRKTLELVQPPAARPYPDLKRASIDRLVGFVRQEISKAQSELIQKHSNYREKHTDGTGVWVKMATPAAQPPLEYEKLKQITVEACASALGPIEAYDHSKTENWNTTIINTILSQLVGETEGQDSQQQSKWKFVVNSTIIQHRSSSVLDEAGKQVSAGRRGMHSAAGAYWNNERDGMWSFKYEAADKMGLDVIVGIVWIWVG